MNNTERYIDYAADALEIEKCSVALNELLTRRKGKQAKEKCATIIAAATRLYGYCLVVELSTDKEVKIK